MKSSEEFNKIIYEKAGQKKINARLRMKKYFVVVTAAVILAVSGGAALNIFLKKDRPGNPNEYKGYLYDKPAFAAQNLMNNINAQPAEVKNIDDIFINAAADFSVELFKKSIDEKENSLVSPLSVLLALSMTQNGAAGETLKEMEKAVGRGITIDSMNEYLYSYVKSLLSTDEAKLSIANSIWFDGNRMDVKKDFLQKNANFYGAAAYKADFNARNTLDDINNWVKKNTGKMIEKIINEIDPNTVMYLINAIAFDAQWEKPYTKNAVSKADFISFDKKTSSVDFMYSDENEYIKADGVTGFVKPYNGGKYEFAALLPDENININKFISSLTGEKFVSLLKNSEKGSVQTATPKFSYDYSIELNGVLKGMGMPAAFGADADFKRIGQSTLGNIYIGKVLHKTFISVDEKGTKAGAATAVLVDAKSMPMEFVNLNRPFVYAIVDRATKLPVFIGAVMSL